MENRTLTLTMLLDFYGDLLTEKQRHYFDMYHNEDLSLSEIAELEGVSRQAVWDQIRRAEAALEEMEEKTGLLGRFGQMRRTAAELETGLEQLQGMTEGAARQTVERLLQSLRELQL